MDVFRVEKNKDFTVMSNIHLRDSSLSLKAKGLLSYMLSLPEDWDLTEFGLTKTNKESMGAISSAIKELIAAGYIHRSRERDAKGKLGKAIYQVHEKPMLENPMLDNPTLEEPTLENPQQRNTNILNTNKQNTKEISTKYINPPIAPQKGGETGNDDFEWFWSLYPKKVGKKDALKAFKKVKVETSVLVDALEKQKKSAQWQRDKGQFIPHASTWLNAERWNDEVEDTASKETESWGDWLAGK